MNKTWMSNMCRIIVFVSNNRKIDKYKNHPSLVTLVNIFFYATLVNILWCLFMLNSWVEFVKNSVVMVMCFFSIIDFGYIAGARFTKYLTIILRLSYDNAKFTIDLRRSSGLQNILRRTQGCFRYDSLESQVHVR